MGRPPVLPTVQQGAPHLLADWDPANTRTPDQVSIGTSYKALWRCATMITLPGGSTRVCGHAWVAEVSSRARRGRGCPVCPRPGPTYCDSLAAQRPDLAAQWHPDNDRTPEQVTAGSVFRARWRCDRVVTLPDGTNAECGHEWTAAVYGRTERRGCPACAGVVTVARTSLAAARPDLVAQWHPSNDRSPEQVTAGSDFKARWHCLATIPLPDGTSRPCGHQWTANVARRVRLRRGCPACAGRVAVDRTCLATARPDLLAQWHPSNDRTPEQVTVGSNYKARWRCSATITMPNGTGRVCGAEWIVQVAHRSLYGRGCPGCAPVATSKEEVFLAHELAIFLPVVLDLRRVAGATRPWLVDIVDEQHRLIVEYDGSYWHADKEDVDRRKTADLAAAGWTVLRVRERPLPLLADTDVEATTGRYKDTANTVLSHLQRLLDLPLPGLDAYLEQPDLMNRGAAEAHLAALPRSKRRSSVATADSDASVAPLALLDAWEQMAFDLPAQRTPSEAERTPARRPAE
jgi:hypothetical protein